MSKKTRTSFESLSLEVRGGVIAIDGDVDFSAGHVVGDRDGVWARWHWDGQQLLVECDRYGMFPVFYAGGEDAIAVSRSPLALVDAGVDATLDTEALSVFFRIGFFLGNDTPFRSIRVLPPGATLHWQPGSLSIDHALRDIAHSSLSRDQALDEFVDRVRVAIGKRPPTPQSFVLPLSGGRDSRHILLELNRQGIRPRELLTIGASHHGPGSDASVAAELAMAVGIPHRILTPAHRAATPAEFEKNLLTHMCADEHDWFQPLAAALPELGGCTYSGLSGTWEPDGGTAMTAEASQHFDAGEIGEIPEIVFRHFGTDEANLQTLLGERRYRAVPREAARARLERELAEHLEAPNPLGSFWFWNRERREHGLAPYGLMSEVPVIHAPFLDHDVFDLLASLPTSYFRDSSFHTDALHRGYPEFAHIPFATRQSSLVPRTGMGDQVRGLRDLAKYTFHHNPSRLRTVASFGASRFLGRPSASMRMTAYVIQLEALAGASYSSADAWST